MNSISTSLSTPSTPTLYALLVGIGAYERVRALSGPVGDAKSMADYLDQLPGFATDIRLLTDQEASKAAIIEGFQKHLTKAGPADTVLFYFAGHGAQEDADPSLWATETDNKLECLVCHDANTSNYYEFLLADKELRFLLGPVAATGAHVVTIFDCCHAGDNTRGVDLLAAALAGQDVRDRRLADAAPRRPYDAFCFHELVTADQLMKQGPAVALPEGMYIQMAACESDESAVEVNGEGIFTKNLLAVLEAAHGQVTYLDLHNRVRQYMRFGYEQRPRVYVPDLSETGSERNQMTNRGFLNQPIDANTLAASATYNPKEGWLLDVGAIHGMAAGGVVQLVDPTTQAVYTVNVGRVGADYTVLAVADDVAIHLNKQGSYRAAVSGLLTRPIRLHFTNHGGPNNDLPDLLTPTDGIVIPENDEAQADYTLHVRNGLYYITRPAHADANEANRPLIRPLSAADPQLLSWLVDDLRHLAKWEYVKQLANADVSTSVLSVQLTPKDGSASQLNGIVPAAVPITYLDNNGQWTTTLTIQLTNPTDRPLYCTALYLSRDFMSFPGFLPTNYRLEPGQSVDLGLADKKLPTGRKTEVRLKLEEVIRQYNWPFAAEYIKLLITVDPLSEKTLAFLNLDPLPSPPVLADRLKPAESRGGIEIDTDESEPFPDWSTQTISLQLINPVYNTVRADELSQMLTPPDDPNYDDTLADFVLGLYFEPDTTTSLTPTLKLREGMRVIALDDGQRGLWTDLKLSLANTVAQQVQNRQYRQDLLRYPDRIRIVAEGDSWFQYPFLLRDIIDYLSGVYTVFSVAAAGATLADYLKNSEFLEAIAQVKPTFFLLSGGGNDLLGETFATLIRDQPNPQLTGPAMYLTDAFPITLAAVCDRYRRILRLVQLGYPQVRVLLHGYDYVIPSGTEKLPGALSWMGETLTQRGINDPAERQGITRYIVDAFNEQLRQIATEYTNVTYLDLRGTVRRTDRLADYWYDEIHPNDKGFLSLSSKFVTQINRLKTEPVA
ncbi:caspase family protein [uncultured Fibrella sp.]|uniref:caspase family protein n=1 Tax=uncultured Fibrella sp. TaxID=1284596 RepID=UPI0035CAD4C9